MTFEDKEDEAGTEMPIESEKQSFFKINNIPIFFQEDWNQGIGGGLWSTGTAMSQYFSLQTLAIHENLRRILKAKASKRKLKIKADNLIQNENETSSHVRVLELGSGNGFLSLCFLAMISTATATINDVDQNEILSELVVTDMQDHIPLMTEILFEKNRHIIDEMEKQNVKVSVMEHSWGLFPSMPASLSKDQCNNTYDFIFGSDLAYHESLYIPLIKSLKYFSHDYTITLLGVTMSDTSSEFFDLLIENGFAYERLSDDLMGKDFQRQGTFGIFALQKRKF